MARYPRLMVIAVLCAPGCSVDSEGSTDAGPDPDATLAASDANCAAARGGGPNCPAPLSGELRIAAIVVDRPGAPAECSVDTVRSLLFEREDAVNAFYRETSRGALELVGDAFGPYPIAATDAGPVGDCSAMDRNLWADEADQAAADAGVDLSAYDRTVYVMAHPVGCMGGGVAAPQAGRAMIFMPCDEPGLYAHELGHTLLLNHASTPEIEYGDVSDVMGRARSYTQLNGPHRAQLGWADVTDGSAGGTFVLAPLETPEGRVLVIGDLYVSYRARIGFDAELPDEFVTGASIHAVAPCVEAPPPTILVATLTDGETFTRDELTIRQVAHDDAGVTLEVGGSGGCP